MFAMKISVPGKTIFIYFLGPGGAVACLGTDPRRQQHVPLWSDIVEDAFDGARQRQATDQQDGEHQIGEGGSEIHGLEGEWWKLEFMTS